MTIRTFISPIAKLRTSPVSSFMYMQYPGIVCKAHKQGEVIRRG
jgi:hypothetical protein